MDHLMAYIEACVEQQKPFVVAEAACAMGCRNSQAGAALNVLHRLGRVSVTVHPTSYGRFFQVALPDGRETPLDQRELSAIAQITLEQRERDIDRRRAQVEAERADHRRFWLDRERAPRRREREVFFIDKATVRALQGAV